QAARRSAGAADQKRIRSSVRIGSSQKWLPVRATCEPTPTSILSLKPRYVQVAVKATVSGLSGTATSASGGGQVEQFVPAGHVEPAPSHLQHPLVIPDALQGCDGSRIGRAEPLRCRFLKRFLTGRLEITCSAVGGGVATSPRLCSAAAA